MKFKKLMAALLVAMMVVASIGVSAFAAEASEGEVINGSSIVLNTDSWWAQEGLSIEDFLGGYDASEVEKVVFTSDSINCQVGYNNVAGDWYATDWGTTVEVDPSDVDYTEDVYYLAVCISTDDGVDHVITWEIYLKSEETETPEEITPPAEEPAETPTESPTATPSDAESSDQPQTGDNGVVLFAVVGMLALAGVAVTKKYNA